MTLTPIQVRLLKALASFIAILLAMSVCYLIGNIRGNTEGEERINARWSQEKQQYQEEILKLRTAYAEQEGLHRQETSRISEQLRKTEATHEEVLANLAARHVERLRISTQRAEVYQRQAEAGSAQCRDLASHTAELDRALEEGRGLVGELAATLRQRDAQLRLVGAQIANDRQILSK